MNSETPIPPPAIVTAPPDLPPRFPFLLMFSVWLVVVLIATLVTWVLPEQFVSTARIKVEPDQTDIAGLSAHPPTTPAYDPYFLQNQFEIIQSAIVLTDVVEELELNEVWGKRYFEGQRLKTVESISLIRGRLDVRPVRNASIIEIRVYGEEAGETARLANQIAESYQQWRRERSFRLGTEGLHELESLLKLQEAQIRQIQKELAGLAEPVEKSQLLEAWELNYLETKNTLDEALELRRLLTRRIADLRIDLSLPRSSQVMILEPAMPGIKPVRPNKALNIWLGILLGGFISLLLAGLIYLLQRRAHRRNTGDPGPASLRILRNFLRVTIALVVGVIVGYNCAMPVSMGSLLLLQLLIFLGGIALAFVELAKPTPIPDSPAVPVESQLKEAPRLD